jgi:5-formyltetrahydrofolate cyclo-ligase
MKSKEEIRKIVNEYKNELDLEEKKKKDNIIYNKLINYNNFIEAKNIFIYVSYKKEVDTHNIIRYALMKGKSVYVPKIISMEEGMEAVEISSMIELEANKYGILEPKNCCRVALPNQIDFVVLPGVAFDLKGGRVGYGGGFYDRYLANIKTKVPKVALAYSFQIFDIVPMNEQDIDIDGVITD